MFTNTNSHGILNGQCPPTMSRPLLMIDSSKWPCNNVVELAPNCPRCASSNTKFCYYNNYSLSQPRYFCKGCRRYWTKGGSLRNVPVGGGCRKSRRARRHTGGGRDHVGPAYDSTASVGSSEIDMAAVYAKYVNSNADGIGIDNEESYSPGDGSGSSSYNVQTSASSEDCNAIATMFDQYENDNLDLMMIPDIFVDQDVNGAVTAQDDGFTMRMSEDSNVFELLADDHELGFDALWSSGTELQDFGVFSADNDQFGGTSTNNNLVCDNWGGSIDISSHEIFSRNFNFD